MKSKPVKNGLDLAFDDDTSDSDDDRLQEFNSQIGCIQPSSDRKQSDDDHYKGESENDTDSDDSMDSTDSENESENAPKLSMETMSKVSKLKDQLAEIEDDESESDDSDEEYCEKNIVTKVKEADLSGIEDNECAKLSVPSEVESKTENPKVQNSEVETSEEKERMKYREKLSKMSIEDIQKLKERLGLKLFHQKMSGTAPVRGKKMNFKRDNKNRPREMSSKKTVGRFREVVQVAKVQKRDPRFDPLCGEFDEKLFKDNYKFVNEMKSQDLTFLKKQLREEEDPERRKSIKYLIQRTENQLRQEAQNKLKEEQDVAQKNEKKEQLEAGVNPFYISKSKQKEMKLVDQYEKLKESGGLDKYIRKKTKKNLVKDRKRFENL